MRIAGVDIGDTKATDDRGTIFYRCGDTDRISYWGIVSAGHGDGHCSCATIHRAIIGFISKSDVARFTGGEILKIAVRIVSGSLTTVLTGWVLQKSMKSTVYPNDTK